jgi:hypothetical protein
MSCPEGYMQPPFITPSPLNNKVAITSDSPESIIARDNVMCDTGWYQDIATYPAHPTQRDAEVS